MPLKTEPKKLHDNHKKLQTVKKWICCLSLTRINEFQSLGCRLCLARDISRMPVMPHLLCEITLYVCHMLLTSTVRETC